MGGYGSGGSRIGAGRKLSDGVTKVKFSVNLPSWLLSLIRDEAEHRELSTSQLITELITKGLER
ncbi:MAG: hypothetical protein E7082_07355 [Bacteroidales bacterium]|nr:hypothetical protein [Bacteroidales bacterium]